MSLGKVVACWWARLIVESTLTAQPTMNAVAAGYAPDGSIASYFGVQGLAFAVGGVVGNTVGGLLYTVAAGSGVVARLPWFAFLAWGVLLAAVFWRPSSLGPARTRVGERADG